MMAMTAVTELVTAAPLSSEEAVSEICGTQSILPKFGGL